MPCLITLPQEELWEGFIWETDCKTVALEQKINRPFWNEMQMSGVIINP